MRRGAWAEPGAGQEVDLRLSPLLFQKVDVLCGVNIKKVACGTQFSVALTRDGRVFTFGQGELPPLPADDPPFPAPRRNASLLCLQTG